MTTDAPTPSLDLAEMVANQGAKGRRITLTHIKNHIAHVCWLVPGEVFHKNAQSLDKPLCRVTLCFITTKSGFVVVGKSGAMDPKNFDAEKGRTFAYEDAVRQLWPLFAFAELERQQRPTAREVVGRVRGEGASGDEA